MIKHQSANSRKNYHYNAYIYTDTVYHSHFHGNYELIYVLEGSLDFTLGGTADHLLRGEMILISPYMVHGFTVGKDARIWVGVFSDEYVQAFANVHAQTQYSKFTCDAKTSAQLKEQLFYEGQPEQYLCIASLYTVCHLCVQNATPLQIRGELKPIRGIIEYISENLDNDIDLSDLSAHFGYEYHYFSALFHQWFGMHFKAFLNVFRFEKACTLLLRGEDDITEIYRACGFSCIRNFNRVFKQLAGCTPSEYRKKGNNRLPVKS